LQVDFKDASSVTIGPEGKKQHLVEVLNILDEGSSILIDAVARSNYNAESTLFPLSPELLRHWQEVGLLFLSVLPTPLPYT